MLHAKFSAFPLPPEVHDTTTYSEWVGHFHNCQSCSDWELGKRVEAEGRSVSEFPCVHIAYQITQRCDTHPDRHVCPDVLVVKNGEQYGIPIRDGGLLVSLITHCPWCGKKMKK